MTLLEATTTTLPLILPLPEAARAMGVDVQTLHDMVQSGKIPAFVDPDGTMYVQMTKPSALAQKQDDDINARLSRIRRDDFAHLEGVPITVSEAARKYGVPSHAIYRWIRSGYIKVLKERRGGRGKALKIIDEADVAICSAVYKVRKHYHSLAPLLDENGEPYLLKYPELSRRRRT